jgi:hypothetical protein
MLARRLLLLGSETNRGGDIGMEGHFALQEFDWGEDPVQLLRPLSPDFSCRPADIRSYMDRGRWDLVFNALCYLAGAVEEGAA